MTEKILFVDDEPAVLDGYKRMLYRDFSVETAVGGSLGLAALEERGPFAVVVSDMRMPVMSGSQFLSQVRQLAPDPVRMLLTGYSDAGAAISAVNDGQILRFLTKPCSKEDLSSALKVGLVQYRLTMTEKEILEQTLMGGVKVLTEVLGAVSPEAFGRSARVTECVRHLLKSQRVSSPWHVEVAAMLSQIGCLTLDGELIRKAGVGSKLSAEEQARFEGHPKAGGDLLLNIPRLERVAWMVRQQLSQGVAPLPESLSSTEKEEVEIAGAMLRLAVEFVSLRGRNVPEAEAIRKLQGRDSEFPRRCVDALEHLAPATDQMEVRKLAVAKLAVGMTLHQDVRDRNGDLMIAKDQLISKAILMKLQSYAESDLIDKEIVVLSAASLLGKG